MRLMQICREHTLTERGGFYPAGDIANQSTKEVTFVCMCVLLRHTMIFFGVVCFSVSLFFPVFLRIFLWGL
jgi:hypothetical protein